MKTCPNCDGTGARDWAGDGPGNHPCRLCEARGSILEPSDVAWLAEGWLGVDGLWHTKDDPPNHDELRNAGFSAHALMVLIAGANAVGSELAKAALREKGMVQQWRGVIIHPRKREL